MMRSFPKFARQVLTGEVQLLVQVASPFWTIGHIVNDTVISDQFSGAAFARAAAEFPFGDHLIWNVHAGNYTGYSIKRNLLR